MSKRKYRPDYGKLYPGVELNEAVLDVLKKSDRKMEYMEYDLKAERPVKALLIYVKRLDKQIKIW